MSNNIYLFANNNDGVAEDFGYYRLYNMQMRGDSQGVQDGINYVEYLEGDGASWIDTGLITNENTQIEATVQLVAHVNYKAWFGSDNINVGYQTDIKIPFIRLQGNNSVALNLGDNLNTGNLDKTVWKIDTSDIVVGEEIFVVDIDGRKWINFTPTENTNPTMSLKVFSGNFPAYSISETSNGCIKGRIYDFKVFMDNELRMHLRPCLDTEGVPCMYDEVSKEYFYNQGEGEFTYKDLLRDYQPAMDSNGVPCLVDKVNKKYYYGENNSLFSCKETDKKKSVSYIKGDGNSYIDTGIYANPQYKYEIVFEDSDIQKYESLFGADQTECRVIRSIEQEKLAFFHKNDPRNFDCSLNEKHTVTVRNYNVYMDGKHVANTVATDSIDTFNKSTLIFSSYYNNGLDTIGTFKLYSFKMWDENDVLVFDGIPIIEGGIPYLYDRVSNRTLQNQGSGNFTYGIEKFTNGIVSDVPLEEISQSICDVIPTFAKMCDDGSYCMYGRFLYNWNGLSNLSIEAYAKGKGLRLKPNTQYTIYVKTDAISKYSSVNPRNIFGYNGNELGWFEYNKPTNFITDKTGRTFIYTYHDTIYTGEFPFYIYLLEGDYVDYIKNNEVDFATSIDYLQADGTQYINTNVEINDSLDIDMECRPMVNNAGHIMNNTSLEGTYKYNETDTELTSNVSSESKTLTLGNTYGAMLTEEEEFSAYEQGWIIDGATANATAVVSANTDISTLGTNETITSAYIELTNDNYQTRVDDILAYYPNCINVNLYDDGSVVSLETFMSGERNAINQQVENVTFMEGYFRNVKKAGDAFRWCQGLKTVSNLPNSLEKTGSMFRFCKSLESVTNIPTNVTDVTEMFYSSAIREVPPFPSNYTGKFEGVFYDCGNLIEAPIIPDGVTSMANCFMNCRNLTTVPNIPSSCTNFNTTFSGCTNLISVPTDGWNGYMGYTFLNCTSLNQEINITNANTLAQTFKGCTSLSITPSIETDPTVASVSMDNCFEDCSSLIMPPITPSNVKSMGYAYRRCTNLEVAPNIPSDVTYMAYMLSNCKKIKEVTIPIGIIEVGNNYTGVIEGCSALENVDWDGNIGISLSLNLLLSGFADLSERDFHELIARTTTAKWSSTTLTLSDNYITMLTGGEIMNLTNKGWTIANSTSTSTVTVKSYETISKDMTISTTNEDVTALVIELTSDNYKTRIDEILAYYPNVNDISFYDDGSVTSLGSMFGNHMPSSGDYNNNKNHKNQITHVTFIDGYFENLTILSSAFNDCKSLLFVNNIPNNVTVMENTFRSCSGLIGISNIPTSVRHLGSCFHSCSSFNQMVDLSNVNIDNSIVAGSLIYLFYNCTSLTYTPILPSNYVGGVGGLQNAFQNCQALKEVPIIPSGVTNLSSCFNGCISMTGKPVVPSGVTSLQNTFYNTKITEVTIPLDNLVSYQNAVTLCDELENIIWVGTRNTDFSFLTLAFGHANTYGLIDHLGEVDSATLILNDSSIEYLTSEEIISLQEKGWTLNSSDGVVLASVPQDLNISTLTSSETVKMACIELTNSNYTSRIGNVLALYPNCNHLIFYEDGSITKFESLFALGNNGGGAYRSQVEKISFAEGYFKNVNTLNASFAYCNGLKTVENIPLSSKVTYLGNMFMGCTSLNQPIDLSTCVNCTNLSQTFRECTSLTYAPILPSNCNVMNNCFQSCKALTEVPIMPSGVTNLNSCFNGCTSLTSVNATGWVTNQVTNIGGIFSNCTSLTSVNTTDWDTSQVTNMDNMFSHCAALTEIIGIENWDTSKVTNMSTMFSQCENLTSLNISNWKTGQVVDMGSMFYGVHIEEPLNLNKWDVSKVDTMLSMFRASRYTSIDISSWDTSNVVNFETMFMQCRATELKLPSKFVRSIEGKITNMYRMFNQASVISLDVTEWDIQNVNNLTGVFMMCVNLTEIKGIENWNTSKITSMNQLFYQCKKLTSLNISEWETGQVTDMGSMFQECEKLETIDMTKWDTSKVASIYCMFKDCVSLTSLDMSRFTNCKDMGSFCINCTNLVTITGLDTSKYSTNFGGSVLKFLKFEGCTSLRNIKNVDVTFTSAMAKAYGNSVDDNQNYWMMSSWQWFYRLTNLVDITFTGQLELYDTMSTYHIFRGCDTTKFTTATWNTFVSIFPTTPTSKSIVMGSTQAILDAVPDEIKLALTEKGYTLTFMA